MLAYGGFSWDSHLVDDNVCQWYPIIETAYNQFFSVGRMPAYDFFQSKGLPIANMGYYSLYNPFMLVAYGLSRVIPFNLIAIYICILSGLGNVYVWLLCKKLDLKTKEAIICTLAYSSSACFVAFHNWYYVFNNYLIIPLLFLSVFANPSKIKYFGSGTILALSLFLGNIQYTCYHYITYLIIMSLLFCARLEKKILLTCLFNILFGLLLSAPIILMGLNVSSNFEGGRESLLGFVKTSSFLAYSFTPFLSLLNFDSIIPFDSHLEFSAAVTFPFVVGSAYFLFQIVKSWKSSNNCHFVIDCCKNKKNIGIIMVTVLCLFWLDFLGKGLSSLITSVLPVVSRFRFLFKVYFILIPLLGIYLILFNQVMEKRKIKKIVMFLVSLLSILGIVNNFVTYSDSRHLFIAEDTHYSKHLDKENRLKKLNDENVDYLNFRLTSFFKSSAIAIDHFYFEKTFNRNYPTILGQFSLSAYDIATPKTHLDQFNQIYSNSSLLTVYGNNGVNSHLAQSLNSAIDILEKQIRDNSVKYLIVQNDPQYSTDYFAEKMTKFDSVHVESIKEWDDDYALITLGGIPSLCRFNDTANISLNADFMDELSFRAIKSGKYTLSFSYEKNLSAYAVNDNGSLERLDVYEAPNGNIELICKRNQQIFVTYKDPLSTAAQILECLTTILFLFVAVKMITSKENLLLC